jgi:hypothetical protein
MVILLNDREGETCFGEQRRRRDYFSIISFGFFLLAIGIVFTVNPSTVSDFGLWVERMTTEKILVRPPDGLIASAVLFFSLIGLSGFFQAGIGPWLSRSKRQVLADTLSGIAFVLFAYLIYLYGGHLLAWHAVLAIEAIAVGSFVILYSTIQHAFLKQ